LFFSIASRGGDAVGLKLLQFIAVVLMALALVPSGAHFFELPNKIKLDRDAYFVVQSIYSGWAMFGVVLILSVLVNLALVWVRRGQGAAFWLVLAAFICGVSTLAIFFAWTYPANVATDNWTAIPADWQELRRQWEYSHALNAVIAFIGFCALAASGLVARE
jgi:hypothetical protein